MPCAFVPIQLLCGADAFAVVYSVLLSTAVASLTTRVPRRRFSSSLSRSSTHNLQPLRLESHLGTGRGRQPDNKYKELKPYQTSLHDVFQTIIGLTPKLLLAIVLLPSFMAPLESGCVCDLIGFIMLVPKSLTHMLDIVFTNS